MRLATARETSRATARLVVRVPAIVERREVTIGATKAPQRALARLHAREALGVVVPASATETAVDHELRRARVNQTPDCPPDAATTRPGQSHEALATIATGGLALQQAKLFERRKHSTDRRGRDPEHAPEVSLPNATSLVHHVHEVKSGGGEPELRECAASNSQDAVMGAFETEEDGIHRGLRRGGEIAAVSP
jgi:hypothetical protein